MPARAFAPLLLISRACRATEYNCGNIHSLQLAAFVRLHRRSVFPAMTRRSSFLETYLPRIWQTRGIVAALLWPLSWLYGIAAAMRRWRFRTGSLTVTRLPIPVVIVGNLYVGGTGKTPLVIWLVEALGRAGRRPGVISRGYGGSSDAPQIVTGSSLAREVGDEPLLIAQRAGCPVVVSRRRVAAAQRLLQAFPDVDVIVSDDGLQHYALARDVEIVLFDARGVGNGWLLPAGPLREPASRPRDVTVINAPVLPSNAPGGAWQMILAGDTAWHLAVPSQSVALSSLQTRAGTVSPRIAAAAGIGNPSRFFGMLRNLGLSITEIPLPDHYDYAEDPFARIDADLILITEKDAVKCRQHPTLANDARLWVVPVSARIDGALAHTILEKLRGPPTA